MMSEMNILFLIGSLQSGGAERVASILCGQFAEEGINVSLVTGASVSSDFYTTPSNVNRFDLGFNYSCSRLFRFFEEVRRLKLIVDAVNRTSPDILIGSTADFAIRVGFLKRLRLIPKSIGVIGCEHNTYFAIKSLPKRLIRSFSYRGLDRLVVLTAREFRNYKKIKENLVQINNPLGVSGPCQEKVLNKPPKLLAVGRLTKQKGYERLLKVCDTLSRRGLDFHLNILGDGELLNTIQDEISRFNLTGKVTLLGNKKDVDKYYQAADVFVMTSYWEGLPMVIPEAMSFGLPIVCFDCETGPREILFDGKYGVLVKDDDIEEYVNRLGFLIKDVKLYAHYSKLSCQRALHFRASAIAPQWYQLFERVLKNES